MNNTAYNTAWVRNKRIERKAKGLCVQCGARESRKDRITCVKCSERQKRYTARAR